MPRGKPPDSVELRSQLAQRLTRRLRHLDREAPRRELGAEAVPVSFYSRTVWT